jgi:hypothetical protein
VTLVAHVPVNDPDAPLAHLGEKRVPMVRVDDTRLQGTGYSIYAASASWISNDSLPPVGVTYDIVGTKGGEEVANKFFKMNIASCQNAARGVGDL